MVDPFEGLARIAKPDAPELDKRNRESGLLSGVKTHSEDPDTSVLTDGYSWVSFAGGVPVLKAYHGGVVYETALTDPSIPPPSPPPPPGLALPDYDSGFISVPAGTTRIYSHGIGDYPKVVMAFQDLGFGERKPLPLGWNTNDIAVYISAVTTSNIYVLNREAVAWPVLVYAWEGVG